MRRTSTLAVLALLTIPATALAAGKGTSLFSIGLSQGGGDYAGPEAGTGYISAFQTHEIGVTGEYWNMLSDDYAFAVQGTFGFTTETNKPGTNAVAGSPDAKFSSSSFKVRVGGDRVGQIGDRFMWFMGPGLEFWSGKAKFENFFSPPYDDVETESTTRVGVNGRVGGVMMLSDGLGVQGQVGHTLGYATAEEAGAKATWTPSSFNASWGLTFVFGGS